MTADFFTHWRKQEAAGLAIFSAQHLDLEQIAALYRKHKTELPAKLPPGMPFAFAIHDPEKNMLFLCRDAFGFGQICYHTGNKGFTFGSDLNRMQELSGFDRNALRTEAILDHLYFQYIPREKTIYTHTFKLLPGHSLTYDLNAGKFTLDRWFTPDYKQEKIPYKDACTAVLEQLTKSVQNIEFDGVLVSGGLDSALSLALACRAAPGKTIRAYTLTQSNPLYDESEYAAETVKFLAEKTGCRIEHKFCPLGESPFEQVKRFAALSGEPFADSGMLSLGPVCEFAARDGVKKLLTGDCADELYYGYERYRAMRLAEQIPCPGLIAKLLPAGAGERTTAGRLRRLCLAAQKPRQERYLEIVSHGAADKVSALAGESLKDVRSCVRGFYPDALKDPADAAARFDFQMYLPGDICVKNSLCEMYSGVSLRSPFPATADLAFKLPADYKLLGAKRKRILLDAFADILPPDIAARPKKGFGIPLADLLRGPWRKDVADYLLKPGFIPDCYVRRDIVDAMLKEHAERRADHSTILFSLLTLALFFGRE